MWVSVRQLHAVVYLTNLVCMFRSCYAFAASEMLTDRINLRGLYGAGWSTFPQDGCDQCLPANSSTCSEACTADSNSANTGKFGWCANPGSNRTNDCCSCSTPGLPDNEIVSPENLIACNQEPWYWLPTAEWSGYAQLLSSGQVGGCNGGYPMLMMQMLSERGAGTCKEDTNWYNSSTVCYWNFMSRNC